MTRYVSLKDWYERGSNRIAALYGRLTLLPGRKCCDVVPMNSKARTESASSEERIIPEGLRDSYQEVEGMHTETGVW